MNVWALLFLFSFYGLCAFAVRQLKLPRGAAPLMAVCAVTLFVFGFGLLGFLRAGLYLITGIGVLYGLYTLATAPTTFLRWETLLFLLACGLLWLRYHGALLLQYDDFSHWGLIARHLLLHNALPDGSAVLIQFQSYPPAAACWIYAVCFFTSGGDGMMITAQAWFALIALLPLFAVAEDYKLIKGIGVCALIVIVLSMYQGTASLMVDNLLAALAIGAAALVLAMRHMPGRAALPLGAMLATLCLVKDSGLYFAILALCLYGFVLYRGRQPARLLLWPVALPALARGVWWVHIKLAFPAATLTKHAFTMVNMRSVSADRTWENFLSIGKAVARSTLTRGNQSLQLFLLMLCCCIVVVLLRYLHTRKLRVIREGLLLTGSGLAYGFYLLGLLGMYFFTMPLKAALEAVAFERYNITFALFLYGLFGLYLLLVPLRRLPFRRAAPLLIACMLALPAALPAYRCGVYRLVSETYRVPVCEQLCAMEQARPLLPGETAALYIGSQSLQEDFVSFIAKYTFQQTIPIYSADTLPQADCPRVLYALQQDALTDKLAAENGVEIIAP